jgi:hypothetical protein
MSRMANKHVALEPPETLQDRFRDAIAPRTLALGLGVLLLQLIFVILGNPSAGGAYQPSVLPPFWRAISSFLPNGAGTEAIRRIVYFDGHGITHSVVVLVTLLGAAVLHRGSRAAATTG